MPKITISPGQALLILLDKHKDTPQYLTYEKWYVDGIPKSDHHAFYKAMDVPELKEYEIATVPQVINEDPSRRYFETRLAYESLQSSLKEISIESLEAHIEALTARLNSINMKSVSIRADRDFVLDALDGKLDANSPGFAKNYGAVIKQIDADTLFKSTQFGDLDRKKVRLILQASLLGVALANYDSAKLPLDLMSKAAVYQDRGKKSKDGRSSDGVAIKPTTLNSHLGLMRSHAPLTRSDILEVDPDEKPLNERRVKSADKSTFDPESPWVRDNFSLLTQPFSNSISGTMLGQLRSIKAVRNEHQDHELTSSSETFTSFLKCFMGAGMLSGGCHTLHEYTAPLMLDEVKKAFSEVTEGEDITLGSLFHSGDPAFDAAIIEAITYNNMILIRTRLQQEVRAHGGTKPQQEQDRDLKMIEDIQEVREKYQPLSFSHTVIYADDLPEEKGGKKSTINQSLMKAQLLIMNGGVEDALTEVQRLKSQLIKQYGEHTTFLRVPISLKGSIDALNHLETKLSQHIDATVEENQSVKHV